LNAQGKKTREKEKSKRHLGEKEGGGGKKGLNHSLMRREEKS